MEFMDVFFWLQLFLFLIALGGLAGFLAGLLGIGGGAVLVPGLFYIFSFFGFDQDILMHMAVGSSLAVIVPTGFSSARAHWRREAVDFDILRGLAPGVFVGSLAGAALADMMSGQALKVVFACAIVALAVLMVFNPARFVRFERGLRQPFSFFAGGFIGSISSLIGIGGATLSVPYMSMGGVDIRRAIGTAAALGLVISVPGVLGFMGFGWDEPGRPPLSLGYVSVPACLVIMSVSVFVAPLGAAMVQRVPTIIMRRGFAVFMVLVAIKMAVDVL